MPAGLSGQNVLIHGRKQATVRQIHCMYPYILNMYFCVFCILRHQMGSSNNKILLPRGGSRTAATSKMEHFVIIVNGWKPLTVITKSSILNVAAVLDPPLHPAQNPFCSISFRKFPAVM